MIHNARCSAIPFLSSCGLAFLLYAPPDFAVEHNTTPSIALRVQHDLSETSTLDATFNARFNEVFAESEREIAELRYDKRMGSNEFTTAYNLQFDRRDQAGVEHRIWQQLRHRFALQNSSIESSARIEERYFTASDKAGARLRILNRWNKTLSSTNQMRIGYEWIFNFNDVSNTNRRGVSQNRLIGSFQHTLADGNRLEFEYQVQYHHVPFADNRIRHQLQMMYVYDL